MTDTAIYARIEELESRLMHQEATIDELTRSLLQQEQLLNAQALSMERLQALLRSLSDPHTLPPGEESPPPHY